MCEPATIATLSVTALSTALAVTSQVAQGNEQKKAARASAEANSQAAADEAATQRQLAQNEIAKGEADRTRQARAAAQRQGELGSALGASGFTMDSGSSLSLLADSAGEEQYDMSVITQNAAQSAWQHQVAATKATNAQSMYDYQKKNSGNGLSTALGVGGTILGGVANGLGQYNGYSNSKTAGNQFNMIAEANKAITPAQSQAKNFSIRK